MTRERSVDLPDGNAASRPEGDPAGATEATNGATNEATTGATPEATTGRRPDWWHRDHPTFTALAGFFTGLACMIVVPGLFAAVLNVVVDYHTAEDLFPFVLVLLAVPIALLLVQRTRRFGTYMLIGMLVTLVVVSGVTALVLWYMFQFQS